MLKLQSLTYRGYYLTAIICIAVLVLSGCFFIPNVRKQLLLLYPLVLLTIGLGFLVKFTPL
nr:MAG TPA: hypothetical protein [Caudoviricetes sp.]